MNTYAKPTVDPGVRSTLTAQIKSLAPNEAAALIERAQPAQAVEALQELNPAMVQSILAELDKGARRLIAASAPPEVAEQWKRNTGYLKGTIGHMMEAPIAVFRPEMTVGEAIEALLPLVRTAFVTYLWVADASQKFVGWSRCATAFNEHSARLDEVMLRNPFCFRPTSVPDAMKLTVNRHYP